jgi:hypothetical protein
VTDHYAQLDRDTPKPKKNEVATFAAVLNAKALKDKGRYKIVKQAVLLRFDAPYDYYGTDYLTTHWWDGDDQVEIKMKADGVTKADICQDRSVRCRWTMFGLEGYITEYIGE